MNDLLPVRQGAAQEPPNQDAGEEYEAPDPSMFEGPAVEPSLLEEWSQVLGSPQAGAHQHLGDLFSFPRRDDVVEFLKGLTYEDIHREVLHAVANPLGLMRPPEIAGYYEWGQAHGAPWGGVIARKDPSSDSGLSGYQAVDNEQRLRWYVKVLHAYDSAALAIAEALNVADLQLRLTTIGEALERGYSASLKGYGYSSIQHSPNVTEARRWLAIILLSLLDHPDDRISVLGRLRALECLRELDTSALGQALGKVKNLPVMWYTRRERLPWSFVPPGSDIRGEHDVYAIRDNERLQQVWVRTSSGKTDWVTTTNRLIHDNAREAVQIMFLLMQKGEAEGALGFLQAIPGMHPNVIAVMLGDRASFRIEHKLAAGVSEEVLIGAGLLGDVRYDVSIDDMSVGELRQQARLQQVRIQDLEAALAHADQAQARLAWMIDAMRGRTEVSPDARDPMRYYRTLGLHPSLFEGRSADEASDILKRVWRVIALERHPDKSPDLSPEERAEREAAFKQAEQAYAVLGDARKRELYDQGLL